MERALALARLADGRQHPNPQVGAVVVCGGRVVGKGFHARAGGPHAEVVALREAGPRARGADLYVTLEPCAHVGRTPPCVEAILAAGVRRVVYGMRDPNPKVAGLGLRRLRAAGVQVVGPVQAAAAAALNPIYLHWVRTRRPYVILKVAMTLDGKIADADGHSQWITNAAVRAYSHEWRARVDGIVVGRRTALLDDPCLTVRLPRYRGSQPTPMIWVGAGAIPWRARLLSAARSGTYCIVSRPNATVERRLARRGHRLVVAASVRTLLHILGRLGVSAILMEGGAATIGAFIRARAVDYCIACVAPKLLGGSGLGWTDALGWKIAAAPNLQVEKILRLGDNVIIEGKFRQHA
ncbi:MAG: bifunctional diaminohydroxyphosphoribosylaminopyrimidine deaminase/5-amino-6-(5-phosphoribosylamino)uracil reductase RibD [Deltaproteobacteria bacterium]|nr:bifunctional diaminohydroxyphosphoribosylaminopyrimidine deaminase/5-amino-6-(5-phosphoribosylamino)uracil reductase RibD [Deltaproteobacteria bacterium]